MRKESTVGIFFLNELEERDLSSDIPLSPPKQLEVERPLFVLNKQAINENSLLNKHELS